jgi:hypothetical protein
MARRAFVMPESETGVPPELAEWVAESRAKQGLPAQITDADAIAKAARLVAPLLVEQRSDSPVEV